jgi:hypothetical protein
MILVAIAPIAVLTHPRVKLHDGVSMPAFPPPHTPPPSFSNRPAQNGLAHILDGVVGLHDNFSLQIVFINHFLSLLNNDAFIPFNTVFLSLGFSFIA